MTIRYLVNLGNAQLYFDATLQRCKPPGSFPDADKQTLHFVRVSDAGTLLTTTWDIGLAEFTAEQRERAELYRSADA